MNLVSLLSPSLPPSLSPSLSVVAVGGDGTVNEVLTALVMQAQVQSGVNTRRSRFAPVSVNQRLGIVPTGLTNSVARSVLGCMDPYVAAAQIMLGEPCPELFGVLRSMSCPEIIRSII